MPLDKDLTWRKLDALWGNKDITVLDTKDKKYAIFSDTHLGNGGEADDFYGNREALINALSFYQKNDFALILLGDIEEFWQFDLEDIVKCYADTIYSKIQAFGVSRVYRIFGNHDREWGGWIDPIKSPGKQMGFADEAIKMRDTDGEVRLLLVHGHQGSIDADKYSWFSRFFVRIYSGIEFMMKYTGVVGHTSATKSQVAKDYERTLYSWAKSRKVMLLCGHSHRAIFASISHSENLSQKITNLQAEN
jgi:UDP-2,3-diacylglucosamine pyrophosphatase LpxH